MTEPRQSGRTLTDEDVEAILAGMEERFMSSLYKNIGKGVWAVIQKVFITFVLAIAAYGYMKGIK